MNTVKKKISKPLHYEKWIHIECPECAKNKEKIMIALPLAGLPKTIQCFSCLKTIRIENILKKGKEVIRK